MSDLKVKILSGSSLSARDIQVSGITHSAIYWCIPSSGLYKTYHLNRIFPSISLLKLFYKIVLYINTELQYDWIGRKDHSGVFHNILQKNLNELSGQHNILHIRSLGQEDLLEKEMATHSSILAWRIPLTEEPGRLPSIGLQKVRHD